MSDDPQGGRWWLASDGKWYPPDLHPDFRAFTPDAEDRNAALLNATIGVAKVRERVFAEVHGARPATRPADEQVAPHNGFGPKQRFRGRVTPAAPASPGTLAAEEPSPPAEAGRSAPAGEATVSVELPRFKREEVPEPSETSRPAATLAPLTTEPPPAPAPSPPLGAPAESTQSGPEPTYDVLANPPAPSQAPPGDLPTPSAPLPAGAAPAEVLAPYPPAPAGPPEGRVLPPCGRRRPVKVRSNSDLRDAVAEAVARAVAQGPLVPRAPEDEPADMYEELARPRQKRCWPSPLGRKKATARRRQQTRGPLVSSTSPRHRCEATGSSWRPHRCSGRTRSDKLRAPRESRPRSQRCKQPSRSRSLHTANRNPHGSRNRTRRPFLSGSRMGR